MAALWLPEAISAMVDFLFGSMVSVWTCLRRIRYNGAGFGFGNQKVLPESFQVAPFISTGGLAYTSMMTFIALVSAACLNTS